MIVTHPQCGKSWKQFGNQTGHCSNCHETFASLEAFDHHQEVLPEGGVRCHNPAEMTRADGTGWYTPSHARSASEIQWSRARPTRPDRWSTDD